MSVSDVYHGLVRVTNFDVQISPTLCKQYRKVPKFSDTRIFCCNVPKIQTKRQNFRIFRQKKKDTNGIASSEDPDQTAPSSRIWVCTVCSELFVQKIRIITVYIMYISLVSISISIISSN